MASIQDEEMKDTTEVEEEDLQSMMIRKNQNFTPIHENKRLPQPVCIASLCPTMDLIAIGFRKKKIVTASSATNENAADGNNNHGLDTNAINKTNCNAQEMNSIMRTLENNISYSNSISVYRTMSWQKMFVVTETDLSNALSEQKNIIDESNCVSNSHTTKSTKMSSDNNNNNSNNSSNNSTNKDENADKESSYVSQLSWSPDGRTLVLGLNNGSLLLYDIESSASPAGGGGGGVPPKPVVFLPSPPSLSNDVDTGTEEKDYGHDDGHDDEDNNNNNRIMNHNTNKNVIGGETTSGGYSSQGGGGDGNNGINNTMIPNKNQKRESYDDEDGSLSSMLSTSTTSPMSNHSISAATTTTSTSTAITTNIFNNNNYNNNNNNNNAAHNQFSPVLTRSKAAARRKQQLQLQQQSSEKSVITIPMANTSSIQANMTSSTTSTNSVHNNNNNNNNHIDNDYNKTIQSLFKTQDKNSILSLQWQRINPIYKDWNKTIEEENEEVSWSFQSHYLDKATHFLPPCAYNATYPRNKYTSIDDELNSLSLHGSSGGGGRRQASENFDTHNDFDETIDRYRPKCETPLSVLFSVTAGNGIHLYLQGRYRLLSLPSPITLCNQSTSIKASSDLSCILISVKESIQHDNKNLFENSKYHHHSHHQQQQQMQSGSNLILYSIPNIIKKRYQLQTITSSYCSIMSHLTTIHGGMNEASSAWSGALRQLDMKFDQLSTLLKKYGVMPSTSTTTIEKMAVVRMELLNYILGGHSKRSTDTSNAMDQFFTNPLMNDQLLQRLIRPLEANVAGVEGIIRKKILSGVRALMYDVGELHGLVKVMNIECTGYNKYDDEDEDHNHAIGEDGDLPLMNGHTSLRLYEASEVLYFVAQQCVSQLVEIRIRLNAIMKWIRGTASQVKARGTAMDSVQRENARKRRVPATIVRKIADFLSTTLKSDGDDIDGVKRGSSECILGILFSDYFTKDKVSIEKSPTPLKQRTTNGRFGEDVIVPVETPSVKAALEISTQIAIDLFEEPRSIRKTAIQTRICLEEQAETSNKLVRSIHTRIGAATNSIDAENCFDPSVVGCNNNIRCTSRHWIIIANTCTSTVDSKSVLQISALPKDQIEVQGMGDFEEDNVGFQNPYYLTTFIGLPDNCQICDIVFYGDDGNSTLTSETSASNEEGRQSLGLLLRRRGSSDDIQSEEVWLFAYDDLDFRLITLPANDLNDNLIKIQRFDTSSDVFCLLTNDAMMEEDETQYGTVSAKCKFPYIKGLS